MSLFEELRSRRVPQYVSAYVVAGWGLIQFVQFLEGRLQLSPHVMNLVAATLVLLLPAVAIIAWSQGRPGRDAWGRFERFAVPTNLVVAAVVLFVLFHGKDLGAITTTVAVQDEEGVVTERAVPKAAFQKRVVFFDLAASDDDWLADGIPTLTAFDLMQDPFLEPVLVRNLAAAVERAGGEPGTTLPRSFERKLARDRHARHFVDGSVSREGDDLVVVVTLQDAEKGRTVAERQYRGDDVFALCDEISRQLRRDLDIPAAYIDEHEDVPVSELFSTEVETAAAFIRGTELSAYANDWEGAAAELARAVDVDPTCAYAQETYAGTLMNLGRNAEGAAASRAAMDHLYRLPERVQFQIKAAYYFNVEEDPDKSMAVVDMWTTLYPRDAAAFKQKAFFQFLRYDLEGAIASYERALEIDPEQAELYREIGGLYQAEGDYDKAEASFRKYADLHPRTTRAWKALADLQMSAGDLDEARATYEKVLLLDDGDLEAKLALARILFRQGDAAEATARLDALLAATDDPADLERIESRYVTMLRTEGRLEEAVRHLELWREAAERSRNPIEFGMLYALRLELLCDVGRSEEALRRADEIRARMPDAIDDLGDYGKIEPLLALGRIAEAQAVLDSVIATVDHLSIEVWRPNVDRGLGLIATARGDHAAAAEHHARVYAKDPANLIVVLEYGRSLRDAGRTEEAREVFEAGRRVAPANPELALELAKLAAARGDREEALGALDVCERMWAEADEGFGLREEARELRAEIERDA